MAKRMEGPKQLQTAAPPAPMIELTTRLPYPIAEGIIALATLSDKSPGAIIADALNAYYINGEVYKPLDQPGRRIPINYNGLTHNLQDDTTNHHHRRSTDVAHDLSTAHDDQLPPEPADTERVPIEDQEHEDDKPKPKEKKRKARARKHWTQRPEGKRKLADAVAKGHRTRKRNARLAATTLR
jgi:hypothetical protein